MNFLKGSFALCFWFGLFGLKATAATRYETNATSEFTVTQRYLNLPVKNGAPQRHLALLVDGQPTRNFDIELADGEPDWWAFIDVSSWKGSRMVLRVDILPADSQALRNICQTKQIKNHQDLYREALRPQFHFSSRRGWNNDPNGLAFFKGEYHLFYQHNPFGWNWGNMHWGHATSRDLVHWKEYGDVLAPDEWGPMFSGSAVVDWNNTSGLGRPNRAPLVLVYTAAGNPTVQCLAASEDGKSFRKYEGNPVLKQITSGNRDPKVCWYEPTRKWVMTLYVETNQVHTVHFLTSPNLKDWTVTSTIPGFFECPDFFELPVDGSPGQGKWVLTAADSDYMLGTFDGTRFLPETGKLRGQVGKGYYAAQTFSDIPARDGRRIRIGWLQAPSPGMPFNQAMSLPTELKLVTTPEGPRLAWLPVRELEALRSHGWRSRPFSLQAGETKPLAASKTGLTELHAEFEPAEGQVLFSVRGAKVTYDGKQQQLTVNGLTAHVGIPQGKQRLSIYVDRTSIEVFASDGLVYLPMPFIAAAEDHSLELQVTGGSVHFDSLDVFDLKSAWKN